MTSTEANNIYAHTVSHFGNYQCTIVEGFQNIQGLLLLKKNNLKQYYFVKRQESINEKEQVVS